MELGIGTEICYMTFEVSKKYIAKCKVVRVFLCACEDSSLLLPNWPKLVLDLEESFPDTIYLCDICKNKRVVVVTSDI